MFHEKSCRNISAHVCLSLLTSTVYLQNILKVGDIYNPGQNVLEHLRKLGTKTHFAKLAHILPLKKA